MSRTGSLSDFDTTDSAGENGFDLTLTFRGYEVMTSTAPRRPRSMTPNLSLLTGSANKIICIELGA